MKPEDNHNMQQNSYTSEYVSMYGGDDASKDGRDDIVHSNETFTSIDNLNNPNARVHDTDVTPNILLEQLAYVDNFIPSLDQDFVNLDSWVLNNEANNTNGHSNMASINMVNAHNGNTFDLDEQLAVELSAFADEVFIFPDEDKPQNHNNENNNMEDNETNGVDLNDIKKDSRFLSQRRNTFLTSQYDNSRSRFSSRRRHNNAEEDTFTDDNHNDVNSNNHDLSDAGNNNVNNDDHGGFTNFEIDQQQAAANNNANLAYLRNHAPSVSSPLANVVANNANSGISQQNAHVSHHQQPTVPRSQQVNSNGPQIHMPDYSTIPTSALVALLPRVKVPAGAYQSLVNAGFSSDQVEAISVIIAYNEQQKQKPKSETSSESSNNSTSMDQSVSFLMSLLSNDKPVNREPNRNQISNTEHLKPEPSISSHASSTLVSQNMRETTSIESENQTSLKRQSESGISSRRTESEPPLKKLHSETSLSDFKSSTAALVAATTDSNGANSKAHQKKKLKGKELEDSINELSGLALQLQQRIHTLEMENKLLKDLVVSSGELEGIEKAESIKQNLLKKVHANEDERKSNAAADAYDKKRSDSSRKEEEEEDEEDEEDEDDEDDESS